MSAKKVQKSAQEYEKKWDRLKTRLHVRTSERRNIEIRTELVNNNTPLPSMFFISVHSKGS
jgi:hypothetical protein